MSLQVLDPTFDGEGAVFTAATRLSSLQGKTVGLVSNGKRGSEPFFHAIAQQLKDKHGVAEVVIRKKGNYSAPMEPHILAESAGWDAAFTGVGD
jgi:hypothetical protein